MINIKTLALLVRLSFTTCSFDMEHSEYKKTSVNRGRNESPMKEVSSQDSIASKKIVTDTDFVFDVFDDALNFSSLEKTAKIKEKKAIPNKYNELVIDTIFTFKNDGDCFTFYKAVTNLIPLNAVIISDRYIIDDSIKVGVPYTILKNRFNLKVAVDTLIVEDFEGSRYFMFLFKEQTLNRIVFKITDLD